MSSDPVPGVNLYPYQPSSVLPIVFAVLVGGSLIAHTIQNFYYHHWRITFFLFYAGIVFCAGWVIRATSSHDPSNLGLYIAQTILIYAGPPIYAAAEYNILGRLMLYLPMHAPLHPRRVKYFFIYLGVLVEALTGAGAGRMAAARVGSDIYKSGGTLVAIAAVLQGAIEIVFASMVILMHTRCKRAGMLPSNVKVVCITLYGCSTLVLWRCVFRAVEAFSQYKNECRNVYCGSVVKSEWYLYAFEAAPMVLYSIWCNVLHPGRFLPKEARRYLDLDSRTERIGPGWIDERPLWLTLADPFNSMKDQRASGEHTKFWLRPEEWVECADGSFALGTATNRVSKAMSDLEHTHMDERTLTKGR